VISGARASGDAPWFLVPEAAEAAKALLFVTDLYLNPLPAEVVAAIYLRSKPVPPTEALFIREGALNPSGLVKVDCLIRAALLYESSMVGSLLRAGPPSDRATSHKLSSKTLTLFPGED